MTGYVCNPPMTTNSIRKFAGGFSFTYQAPTVTAVQFECVQ